MAQSLNELHSFFGKFTQLCAGGFKASLSFKNEHTGVLVNLSAEIGRIESPAFAYNGMIPKKNVTPSQLRRRRRRKAARSKEENAVHEATECAVSVCDSSMEPPSLDGNSSADDLLFNAPSSLLDDCLSPEILPMVSSPSYPNDTDADHFQTTMTSSTSLQHNARIDPSSNNWNQFSTMLHYATSSTENSKTLSSSSMRGGSNGINYPYGTVVQRNTCKQ